MRVALLARVSTEDQAGEARHSLPAQLAAMRARCEREGWEVVREYVAPGESAYVEDLAKRPVLAEAVRGAESGEFELLMVHESSRFARRAKLHHEVEARLGRAGVRWLEADEPLLERTPETFVAGGVKAVLNEYWSQKMGQHIRKGIRERFELGLPVGDVPFGYRNEGPERPPSVVEEEGAAIREVFRLRAGGLGYAALARRLNAAGFVPHSKVGNTTFTASAVQSLLENDFYAGFVRHRGERRPGAHVAVITEDDWLRAQEMVDRQRAPRARNVRMLAGFVECVECGGAVNVSAGGAKGRELYYYREGRRGRCGNTRRMRVELAEGMVDALVASMFADRKWIASLDRRSRVAKPETGERERLQAERTRAAKAWIAGDLAEADYREIRDAIDARLARVPAALPGGVLFAGKRFREWAEVWSVLSAERKGQALRVLWERVYLDLEGQQVYFRPRAEFEELFRSRRRWVLGTPDRTRGLVVPRDRAWLFRVGDLVA
ncbi:MAG: recombinase family protein [Pseudomonadales bacterium]